MRYKRTNALAVDFGVLPKHPGPGSIQKFLETKLELDIAKLLCVQLHSSQGIAYVCLPEDLPAAAIAARHHLQHEMLLDGKRYRIPVLLADDDAVDVRVHDLPPETPDDAIAAELRQYGEVLAITEELWRHFFRGVKSGVRVVRMRVAKSIPRHLTIHGTSLVAHIRYPGQTHARRQRSNETAATGREPGTDGGMNKAPPEQPVEPATKQPTKTVAKQPVKPATKEPAKQPAQPIAPPEEEEGEKEDTAMNEFQIVTRRRPRNRKIERQSSAESTAPPAEKRFFVAEQNNASSDVELDDEIIKLMSSDEATQHNVLYEWAYLNYLDSIKNK